MKYYKVLGKGGVSCHGGNGQWSLPIGDKPGLWMRKLDNIVPCQCGYHLCQSGDLIHWLNEEIYEAEGKGELERHNNNKDVFPQARLIRKFDNWNERTARLFAADCAEHVLHIFEKEYPKDDRPRKVIQSARDFANGKISSTIMYEAMYAAEDAKRSAAWSAAWSAFWSAFWSAAWSATVEITAWNAAMSTAWAAVDATIEYSTMNDERKWQTERLFYYLQEQLT